jgi:broad specificity phosphatase PhoE
MIRHAASEANLNKKLFSRASIALSEQGHKQAQALYSKLTAYHGVSL